MQLVKELNSKTALSQFTENWIWRSLLCLVENPAFNPSPRWIAAKLEIKVEQAVDALEGLQNLELIEKHENSYRVKKNWFDIQPKDLTRDELLETHIKLAPQILTRLNSNDGFTVQFFTGNKELLKEYGSRFMSLYKEMEVEAKRRNITDIMASELSFVQVTKDVGGDL